MSVHVALQLCKEEGELTDSCVWQEHVFDRYKESNEDYMKHARKITFGLRGNKALLDRLVSGSLHGLELAYADDKVRLLRV